MSSTPSEERAPLFGSRMRYVPVVGVAAFYIYFFGLKDGVDLLLLLVSIAVVLVILSALFPSMFWVRTAGSPGALQTTDSSSDVSAAFVTNSDDEGRTTEENGRSLAHLGRRRHPSLGEHINRVSSGNRCGPPPSQLGQ